MYNRYKFNQEFKKGAEREILISDIAKRLDLQKCKKRFTFEKLLSCQKVFNEYIKTHGNDQPVQTSYSWLNSVANRALSYTHYVHTNQPIAKRIVKIITQAIENKQRLTEPAAVFNALEKIKDIHNEMVEERILGTVREGIENTLHRFNLDLSSAGFKEQQDRIYHTLKYIEELDDNVRIYSPNLERLTYKSY